MVFFLFFFATILSEGIRRSTFKRSFSVSILSPEGVQSIQPISVSIIKMRYPAQVWFAFDNLIINIDIIHFQFALKYLFCGTFDRKNETIMSLN